MRANAPTSLPEVNDDDMLSPAEIEAIVPIKAGTIRKAVRREQLKGHRIGAKLLLIQGRDLKELLTRKPTIRSTNLEGSPEDRQISQMDNIASSGLMAEKGRTASAIASVLR